MILIGIRGFPGFLFEATGIGDTRYTLQTNSLWWWARVGGYSRGLDRVVKSKFSNVTNHPSSLFIIVTKSRDEVDRWAGEFLRDPDLTLDKRQAQVCLFSWVNTCLPQPMYWLVILH